MRWTGRFACLAPERLVSMSEADAGPERTEDGYHIIVGGRQWRATDPAIPEKLRAELVAELMAARRLVRTDPKSARPRVQDAKTALGERGYAWWEQPSDDELRTRAAAAIRALLRHRDGSTMCPSDAARIVGGEGWRERMDAVRDTAAALAAQGVVVVQQKGEAVQLPVKGPIRLAPGPNFPG